MNKNEVKKSDVALLEESILAFWQENNIFEETLKKKSSKNDFVFYDGPPFANGLPHYGHFLTWTIKDIIPRYKTMQGYRVPRKWGWDCHGLPIELLVEKELGLETKKDIEDFGLKKFNEAARNSVLRYESEWKRYVPRSGRFVDMNNAYMAMDSSYMESIWWIFRQLHDKSLVKEGFKAMHLCPRCETTLANFEVNQGYKDVTDISVTAKFELTDEPGTFVLAWTTTPWTLPGNVALAVEADIDYISVLITEDFNFQDYDLEKFDIAPGTYIFSPDAASKTKDDKLHTLFWLSGQKGIKTEKMKGSALAGKSYMAPFDYYQNDPKIEHSKNGWKIYTADFVNTDDGTGIVHVAPAFGADDLQLGRENALPFIQHVAKSGAFKHVFTKTIDGGDFAGMFVKQKNDLMSTDIEIIKRLAHDGKLFSKQKLVHSYPHCWRCDTPLLNYATSSWYIDVPSIKDKLIASNKKVKWIPQHIGQGRFGKWLEGARDWALSRSRFWGTPLPVWQSSDREELVVIGSFQELLSRIKISGNRYFGLRHGESVSNVTGVINANPKMENGLTELGRDQVYSEIQQLPHDIDYIFSSPLQRTKETAEIIKAKLGLSDNQFIIDNRLRERSPGSIWEGKLWQSVHTEEESQTHRDFWHNKLTDDAESLKKTYERTMDFMFDIEKNYHNKKILIVSHGGILKTIQFALNHYGEEKKALTFYLKTKLPDNAKVLNFNFRPFPHREDFVIDIHRPYIDDVVLISDSGTEMKRIHDIFDVWFDSASMPYAQVHYPFENKESFEKTFPAQFIAEGLDQTRGWFYVMSVLGNALFGETPFQNVIVNGVVLAEDGKKMSKSLQNYPELYNLFDSVGADAIRLYMINSPVVRGEEFIFSEKGVREVSSKIMGRLRNIVSLFKMYRDDVDDYSDSEYVLDVWIKLRLAELENKVRKGLDNYELDRAARPIFDFVDDFSTWYIRRSRNRFKANHTLHTIQSNEAEFRENDKMDKKRALGTTALVLRDLAKIIAPFVPFIAEEIWQDIRVDNMLKSVHLEDWPKLHTPKNSAKILANMASIREIISEGLQLRSEAKIKVRQPLQSVSIPGDIPDEEYQELILNELNVKEIKQSSDSLMLDTTITEELAAEGNMRELLRQIQSLRKDFGLEAHDKIILYIQTSPKGQKLMEKYSHEIKSIAGISEFNFKYNNGKKVKVGDITFILEI